ncbi:MAG: hypothetical protein ACI9LM_001566 [Alteromonadaceae bacterium]|jgi:hypothetical protein
MLKGIDVEFTEGDQYSFQPLDEFVPLRRGDFEEFVKGFEFYDDSTKYIAASPYI